MLRRKPTRIEVKLEDMEEYETLKKEIQQQQQQQQLQLQKITSATMKQNPDARIGYFKAAEPPFGRKL